MRTTVKGKSLNKVASITFSFWIMKIYATRMSKTAGNLLTKPVTKRGLDFGTLSSSAILARLLVLLVVSSGRNHQSVA